jgi:competence protein ComEA
VPQVIEIGQNAKSFVEAKLAKPFIVVTRMAEGLGHSNVTRILGFVKTNHGADLGEQLVGNGLARIHGTKTVPPEAASAQDETQKLEQLEAKAREAKLGGWNASGSASSPSITVSANQVAQPAPAVRPLASITPVASKPVATPRLPTPYPVNSMVANASLHSTQSAKLDINTATKDELEKVPGIGETLAGRIIAARPFKSADDLQNVKGIGKGKRYEELRPFFR